MVAHAPGGSGGVAAGSTQEVAFQLTDAQFSVIAVATPGKPGVVIDRIAYSAYGEATRTLRSDVNGDGFVNKDDYNGVIRSRLNTTIGSSGYVVEADLDRDGKVAQSDYDIAIADDGKSSSGGVGEAGLFAKGVRNGVGYCGYIFNDESGLYTVRFRSYSPTLGRWLERDPAGYVDGLSLYAYVGSTPITAVDPSGLRKCFTRSINLHPKGLLCDGTDVEFEVCWSCAGGKLTVESLDFHKTRGHPS
jgi:RHS repeat-associated protein